MPPEGAPGGVLCKIIKECNATIVTTLMWCIVYKVGEGWRRGIGGEGGVYCHVTVGGGGRYALAHASAHLAWIHNTRPINTDDLIILKYKSSDDISFGTFFVLHVRYTVCM